jgi:hypothetical protein
MMTRPDPTLVRDLVDDIDVSQIRSAIDELVADIDLTDAADRARSLVGEGTDVLTRESGRAAKVVTGTVVPGTVRIVRRHPRPVVGTLLAVIAAVAIWAWWSRRSDEDDATVTNIERAA